jgi:hypothetical protein
MGFLKIGNLDSRNWKKLTRLEASQFLKNHFLKNCEDPNRALLGIFDSNLTLRDVKLGT